MSYLSRNDGITQSDGLPPGYRLQVTFDEKGCPSTVPLGTSRVAGYAGGLAYRERIARELQALFCKTYGYDYGRREHYVCVCYGDPEGNEVVQCRAKIPPIRMDRIIQTPSPTLSLPESGDIIDI